MTAMCLLLARCVFFVFPSLFPAGVRSVLLVRQSACVPLSQCKSALDCGYPCLQVVTITLHATRQDKPAGLLRRYEWEPIATCQVDLAQFANAADDKDVQGGEQKISLPWPEASRITQQVHSNCC